jgi:hypothetical protein
MSTAIFLHPTVDCSDLVSRPSISASSLKRKRVGRTRSHLPPPWADESCAKILHTPYRRPTIRVLHPQTPLTKLSSGIHRGDKTDETTPARQAEFDLGQWSHESCPDGASNIYPSPRECRHSTVSALRRRRSEGSSVERD